MELSKCGQDKPPYCDCGCAYCLMGWHDYCGMMEDDYREDK